MMWARRSQRMITFSKLEWLVGRSSHWRDAVVKIEHPFDELIEPGRCGYSQRQERQRGQNHLAIAGGLAFVTEPHCAIRMVEDRKHEIVARRIRMAAFGQHIVVTSD